MYNLVEIQYSKS